MQVIANGRSHSGGLHALWILLLLTSDPQLAKLGTVVYTTATGNNQTLAEVRTFVGIGRTEPPEAAGPGRRSANP